MCPGSQLPAPSPPSPGHPRDSRRADLAAQLLRNGGLPALPPAEALLAGPVTPHRGPRACPGQWSVRTPPPGDRPACLPKGAVAGLGFVVVLLRHAAEAGGGALAFWVGRSSQTACTPRQGPSTSPSADPPGGTGALTPSRPGSVPAGPATWGTWLPGLGFLIAHPPRTHFGGGRRGGGSGVSSCRRPASPGDVVWGPLQSSWAGRVALTRPGEGAAQPGHGLARGHAARRGAAHTVRQRCVFRSWRGTRAVALNG